MLEELHAHDLALIEDTWLEFGPGMTVLTGETGAGKTVLLSALKLVLGERADATAVRAGAAEAVVEGRFASGGSETIVKRRVSADGRSRCMLDGEMATVGALSTRLGPLVDLHGQHEHQALLSSATHVGYLDRWAGPAALEAREAYRASLTEWREARQELQGLEQRLQDVQRDAEQSRFVLSEIDRVDPTPGEDVAIEARMPALLHAEKLSEAATEAAAALRADGGALDRVAEASAALDRVKGIDPGLDALAGRLAELSVLIDDAGVAARVYRDGVEHDPAAVDSLQARLSALAGLTRRFGPLLDDVLARRNEARAALEVADTGAAALDEARGRVEACRTALERCQRELAELRASAAPGFCEALTRATADLAMEGACFEVSLDDLLFDSWSAEGGQRVEFLYSPAPGQPPRPLSRIASGGEISRVMLALKGVLGSADQVETLVFDEIDAGIGGLTASAVGYRLASLARTHQVVVVTHLAQVAAFADAHFVVSRSSDADGSAVTTVAPVEGDSRVEEIARMLSGDISKTGRIHAAELLESARVLMERG